jgi:hypothetical protein
MLLHITGDGLKEHLAWGKRWRNGIDNRIWWCTPTGIWHTRLQVGIATQNAVWTWELIISVSIRTFDCNSGGVGRNGNISCIGNLIEP